MRLFFIFIFTSLIFMGVSGHAWASQEQIVRFVSDVIIHQDGSLTVTENIEVESLALKIKRGIVRDLPLLRDGRAVEYEILGIRHNEHVEPYHTLRKDGLLKIFIGVDDSIIDPGLHHYEITYRSKGQLGRYGDDDELYWNVTGSNWKFTIIEAVAKIHLPPGSLATQSVGFSGPPGAAGGDIRISRQDDLVEFTTTAPLTPGEGFTIRVAWPAGYVNRSISDTAVPGGYGIVATALMGFSVVFVYYAGAGLLVARRPKKGIIIPIFYPPFGFSAGAVRYMTKMGFDDKVFAATIVSIAMKGRVVIELQGDDYRLRKTHEDKGSLSPGENSVVEIFFENSDTCLLTPGNYEIITKARKVLRSHLKEEYENRYFKTNGLIFKTGAVLATLALMAVTFKSDDPTESWVLALSLSIWTFGCAYMLRILLQAWERTSFVPGSGNSGRAKAVALSVVMLPFFAGEVMLLVFFIEPVGIAVSLVCLATILLTVVFFHWLKTPTRAGRLIYDKIEGYQSYLSVTEAKQLEEMGAPADSAEVFWKHLPYVMALDLEGNWYGRFTDLIGSIETQSSQSLSSATMGFDKRLWESKGFGGGDSLGDSLASAMAAATNPSRSSSGAGGSFGGHSGGGGGGGGGGGW